VNVACTEYFNIPRDLNKLSAEFRAPALSRGTLQSIELTVCVSRARFASWMGTQVTRAAVRSIEGFCVTINVAARNSTDSMLELGTFGVEKV